MSSVLVTGGLGVIGAWVSRRLVDQGHEVVTYSRHIDTSLVKDITGKITMVSGDVLDLPAILRTIKEHNIDRIVHMATALPDALDANPYNAYRTNVNGIMNLLEAARLVEIKRFIFSSSVAVYDAARGEYAYPTYKGIDEDYPKVPTTVYGATKLFAENMTIIYNERFGVDSIILRFASVYGPGKQVRHGLLALHSKIIESALLNRPLKIRQGGDDKIDMVYVKDIANAVVLACFATSPEHRVFHVGTGRGDTFRRCRAHCGVLSSGA